MDLPKFLDKTRTKLGDLGFEKGAEAIQGRPPAPGAGEREGVIRSFEGFAQRQILDMWCWSAVGCSIADYFLAEEGDGRRSQCSNASLYLGASGCCQLQVPGTNGIASYAPLIGDGGFPHNAGSIPCNQGEWPEKITTAADLSSEWQWHDNGLTDAVEQMIVDSILAGRPVVKYIDWQDGSGGAHVVTIYGVHEGEDGLVYHIADPVGVLDTVAPGEGRGLWRGSMFTGFTAGDL